MSAIAEFLVSWFQSLFNLSLASAVVLRQWKAAFVTLSRRGNISQQSILAIMYTDVYRRIQTYTDGQRDRQTDGRTEKHRETYSCRFRLTCRHVHSWVVCCIEAL